MKKIFLSLLLLFGCCSLMFAEDILDIYYFDRPPYYIGQDTVNVKGFMVDITKLILDEAKIKYEFKERPSKRILEDLKGELNNAVSIGWLKNKERESLYQFSDLIYQDEPYTIVIKNSKRSKLGATVTIKELFSMPMTLGVIDGFVYGQWFDENYKKYQPKTEKFISGDADKPLKMIMSDRFDYMLMSLEEATWIISNDNQFKDHLVTVRVDDAPPGNMRYLLFSKKVSRETIDKINLAIAKVKQSQHYKTIVEKATTIK